MIERSSFEVRTHSNFGLALSTASSQRSTPYSGAAAGFPTSTMCFSAGSDSRTASTRGFSDSSVTSMTAPLSSRRSRTASGPNAEKSGPTTHPALSVPRMPMYSSGRRFRKKKTRSPFSSPFETRKDAKRLVSRSRSANVNVRRAPSFDSQCSDS